MKNELPINQSFKNFNGFPIYYATINDDDLLGMDAVSLVDDPAVEKDFLCFSKDRKIEFSTDNEKHIVTGVAMLADTPIYRRNSDNFEYYIVFTKEMIRKIVNRYSEQGRFNAVNLQHDDDSFVECCHMVESYFVDKERGICPAEFKDVPDGSWIVSYHVNNDRLWDEVKNGDRLNGFSIQGYFDIVPDKKQALDDDEDKFLEEVVESYEKK